MKQSIQVNKTAIYHTLGNVANAKTIWFVLHGYGHLAEYFINQFSPILNSETAVVAPEGLSKFYLKGFNGRVGATWMTKKNREEEIVDYIAYLNLLFDKVCTENNTLNPKINIVGFSQGGATAARWLTNGHVKCTNFILWGSVFPPDMNMEIKKIAINYFLLYGDQDPFFSKDQMEKGQVITPFECKKIIFEGKHDIPETVLLKQTKLNEWA